LVIENSVGSITEYDFFWDTLYNKKASPIVKINSYHTICSSRYTCFIDASGIEVSIMQCNSIRDDGADNEYQIGNVDVFTFITERNESYS